MKSESVFSYNKIDDHGKRDTELLMDIVTLKKIKKEMMVAAELVIDLMRVADEYLLEDLKQDC